MGALSAPAAILFIDLTVLPRPGSPFTRYVQVVRESDGLKTTGNVFTWSDAANDYINPEGRRVIGTWDASGGSNGVPDYSTTLTEDNTALSVTVGGTIIIAGDSITFNAGDLLVRSAGVFFREGTGPSNVFDTIEILGDGNSQAGMNGNFVINSEAIRLGFSRNENGTMVSKQTIGDSIDTDRIFLEGLLTTLNLITNTGTRVVSVYRESTLEENGVPYGELGDSRRPGMFLSALRLFHTKLRIVNTSDIYHADNLEELVLSAGTGTPTTANQFVYDFTAPAVSDGEDTIVISGLEFNNDAAFRIRLLVEDLTTSRVIYQTRTQYEQEEGQGFLITTTGLSIKNLLSVLYLTPGNDYRFTLDVDGVVNFDGDGTTPFAAIHYWLTDDIEMLDELRINDASTTTGLLTAAEVDRRIAAAIITPPVYDEPRVLEFSIDIPRRVDLNTDLNVSHNVTYTPVHSNNMQSLEVTVSNGDDKAITVPTSDIQQTIGVIFSGIDSSVEKTLAIRIEGVDTVTNTFISNEQSVIIKDVPEDEQVYSGFSSVNDPATIELTTLTTHEIVNSGDTFEVSGTFDAGDFLIILVPTNHDAAQIYASDFPTVDFKGSFIKTPDARIIGTLSYISYVIENQGNTGQIDYIVEVL